MKKILVLNGEYLPGYKGGGPIQSIANMVDRLSDEIEFYILTGDRDCGDSEPYSNLELNKWLNVGKAKVLYMPKNEQNMKRFREIINAINFDCIYLNGFFSPIFTIKPLILKRLGKLQRSKYIITPRGDFTGGLEVKKLKKYLYIVFTKITGIYNNLIWHSTSELETSSIRKIYKDTNVVTISNLTKRVDINIESKEKMQNNLKVVFISRICKKKNLEFCIDVLNDIPSFIQVTFDIIGPIEDKEYWDEINNKINNLPANIIVRYKGAISNNLVREVLSKYHLFFLPTLGENYGHVIREAFDARCAVLISDNTPWRDLMKKGIGADISLDLIDKFREQIIYFAKMNSDEFNKIINNINDFISEISKDNLDIKYKKYLF